MLFKNQTIPTHPSKNVVLTVLMLIGTIASYNWFVAPHRNYLLAAQQYESAATDFVKKTQTISNTVTIKQKELKELQDKLGQTHTMLFDPIEARKFLSDIQTVVENANCVVTLLKFSPADSAFKANQSSKNNYTVTQQAKLTVIGSYRNITLLINKLQDRAEQVRINVVTIKPNGNNSGQLKCNMNITIYVINNKEIYAND